MGLFERVATIEINRIKSFAKQIISYNIQETKTAINHNKQRNMTLSASETKSVYVIIYKYLEI